MNTANEPMQTAEPINIYWSLNRASKELGINKSTLSTDAAKGKIQWHDQQDGTRKFFAPELYSFYAQRLKDRTERAERVLNTVTSTEKEHSEHIQNNDLNIALDAKAEVVNLLKAQLEDLRHDRNQWRKQAEDIGKQLTEALTVIKALPAPVSAVELAEVKPQVKRRKFLGLFG